MKIKLHRRNLCQETWNVDHAIKLSFTREVSIDVIYTPTVLGGKLTKISVKLLGKWEV